VDGVDRAPYSPMLAPFQEPCTMFMFVILEDGRLDEHGLDSPLHRSPRVLLHCHSRPRRLRQIVCSRSNTVATLITSRGGSYSSDSSDCLTVITSVSLVLTLRMPPTLWQCIVSLMKMVVISSKPTTAVARVWSDGSGQYSVTIHC
jgi:hypothetical protein